MQACVLFNFMIRCVGGIVRLTVCICVLCVYHCKQ